MDNICLVNDSVLLPPRRLSEPDAWVGHIPFALWIVEQTAPRLLVELGCHSGNSYFAFCQAVQANGLGTHCYAVDTWLGDAQAGYYEEEVYQSVLEYNTRQYGEFSRLLRQTFDEAVAHFSDSSIDLLHIDGLHTYDAVRHDFETWLPKLSERAVVLFHDINVRERNFGVWRLWEELAAEYPHLCFDHSHGLGVLFVGREQPAGIHLLLQEWSSPEGQVRVRRFFERLGQGLGIELHNTVLRQAVAEQEARIADLHREVAQRDQHIAQQDQHIAQQDQHIAEQGQHIAGLNQAVAERDAQLAALAQGVGERDKIIQEIFASTSWRLSSPLRKIKPFFTRR